ncbi:MAG: bifunctional DNA-formamidopyrimidine glycosylase/DNA-(apurinic or apyrimidinic site) lyase [Bdellovibrionaceae bacterium]|nr:bifunctional DNA-formamidopyrimidine glycosylase/DNA-(apurinic or apyrimidinic site) lyase [Pseudobdellovibrionaceae bacterium]
MPELPEVENVRLGLNQYLTKKPLTKVTLLRKDLRFPLPRKELLSLKNHCLLNLERRGKFLIFNFDHLSLFSHLGMTGHWRVEKIHRPIKHDHLILSWKDQNWIYNDPRRFGYIGLHTGQLLKKFGPDPILDDIKSNDLWLKAQGKKQPIKTWLMDQKNILGIGNIYASEVLFACGLHPLRPVHKVTETQWKQILQHTKRILKKSIRLGGSTIKDYRTVDGEKGGFQNTWAVYDKEGLSCKTCKHPIFHLKLSGRATYFCKSCQK